MAEGRILKRQISDSKKLGSIGSDSPRLLYTWLIPWLDIEDRHTADPDLIKGRIFPKCKDWNIKKIESGLERLNDESKSKFKSKEKSIAHREALKIFDEIWKFWWRKEDQGKAKEKFLELINKGVDPEDIKKACIGYLRCEKSKGTGKWFIKYLKTFLYDGNEKRKIPSTWRPYVKYGDEKYKPEPKL